FPAGAAPCERGLGRVVGRAAPPIARCGLPAARRAADALERVVLVRAQPLEDLAAAVRVRFLQELQHDPNVLEVMEAGPGARAMRREAPNPRGRDRLVAVVGDVE